MERRTFLGTVAGALLVSPCVVQAQGAGKVPRVGYLTGNSIENDKGLLSAFREGLADLGYVEGNNVIVEARHAAGEVKRLPALAAEFVQRKVDVIVVSATAIDDARVALAGIPVVFVIADDPVIAGLVPSLARPGGHMTGLSSLNVDLDGKRLEILQAVLPAARRVGVLSTARDRSQPARTAAVERTASVLGLHLQFFSVPSMEQLPRAIDAATRSRIEALMVLGSPAFRGYQAQTALLVARTRLPVVSAWREFPEAGGLLSYGTSVPAMFRRAAVFVDKILKGASPGELPVEQPTRFELVINLKTAKALGLTIPPSLLQRADQVIE